MFGTTSTKSAMQGTSSRGTICALTHIKGGRPKYKKASSGRKHVQSIFIKWKNKWQKGPRFGNKFVVWGWQSGTTGDTKQSLNCKSRTARGRPTNASRVKCANNGGAWTVLPWVQATLCWVCLYSLGIDLFKQIVPSLLYICKRVVVKRVQLPCWIYCTLLYILLNKECKAPALGAIHILVFWSLCADECCLLA